MTHATAAVRNLAEPDRTWEGMFLVDTGVVDCLLPRRHLESIGLAPKRQRICALADGSEVRMDVTTADVEFMGEIVGATIILGESDAKPLLGVTAAGSVGIEVDPRNQTLKRLPSTRLMGLRGMDDSKSKRVIDDLYWCRSRDFGNDSNVVRSINCAL